MTTRQKEMARIKEQISKLEEQLEYLSKLPDTTIEDEFLYYLDDFPWINVIMTAVYCETEKRLLNESVDYIEKGLGSVTCRYLKNTLHMEELTVRDLIMCNENIIASYRGVGKGKMNVLKKWMEKYDLYFIR